MLPWQVRAQQHPQVSRDPRLCVLRSHQGTRQRQGFWLLLGGTAAVNGPEKPSPKLQEVGGGCPGPPTVNPGSVGKLQQS